MLSKEEIENMKADLINLYHMLEKKPSISTNAIENALNYIDQLESDKQNTIDLVKKKIRYFEECEEVIATSNDNYSDGTVIKRFLDNFKEILSYMKGEEK